MGRAVWFFGPSAVGKKTLMLSLADLNRRRSGPLFDEMRIGSQDTVIPLIVPCRSKPGIGRDPALEAQRRHAILVQAREADINAIWLIHGQAVDIKNNALASLARPEDIAAYLTLDRDVYVERALGRGFKPKLRRLKHYEETTVEMLLRTFVRVLFLKDGELIESRAGAETHLAAAPFPAHVSQS